MNENSLNAWDLIAASPYISKSRMRVARCIYENPSITDEQIASRLGIGINRVTPRRCELRDQGVIVCVNNQIPNGHKVPCQYWAVNAHPVITPYRKKTIVQGTIDFPIDQEYQQQEMFA